MLKEYRIKKNITQEKLAELLDITPRQVQRIESGESRPSLRTLKLLIEILEISAEDVVKIIKEIA
ncbi:MAG TPA: helix-turn-helix transcriptional regulator [Candidatus Onthocola stercorigallinarum]|nr:helix-turn-helix transcriptional regulator [Candidatus Onthocola stercorigallinarum]